MAVVGSILNTKGEMNKVFEMRGKVDQDKINFQWCWFDTENNIYYEFYAYKQKELNNNIIKNISIHASVDKLTLKAKYYLDEFLKRSNLNYELR